jgi:hypothetical protein
MTRSPLGQILFEQGAAMAATYLPCFHIQYKDGSREDVHSTAEEALTALREMFDEVRPYVPYLKSSANQIEGVFQGQKKIYDAQIMFCQWEDERLEKIAVHAEEERQSYQDYRSDCAYFNRGM